MKKLIKFILVIIVILSFIYVGGIFILQPIPQINETIIKVALRVIGLGWLAFGLYGLINIKNIMSST